MLVPSNHVDEFAQLREFTTRIAHFDPSQCFQFDALGVKRWLRLLEPFVDRFHVRHRRARDRTILRRATTLESFLCFDFRLQVGVIQIDTHFFRVLADHFDRVAKRVLELPPELLVR